MQGAWVGSLVRELLQLRVCMLQLKIPHTPSEDRRSCVPQLRLGTAPRMAKEIKKRKQKFKKEFPGGLVTKNLRAKTRGTGSTLVQEDSTFHGAAKPLCHSYWCGALEFMSCNPEPMCYNSWSPCAVDPCSTKEKPPQWEACTWQLESSSCSLQLMNSPHSNKDSA